jgi:hypothetical protein
LRRAVAAVGALPLVDACACASRRDVPDRITGVGAARRRNGAAEDAERIICVSLSARAAVARAGVVEIRSA